MNPVEVSIDIDRRCLQLDAALPGPTAQYREVQGHESDLFVSYFRRGLHYVPGTSYSAVPHSHHGWLCVATARLGARQWCMSVFQDEASVPRLLRIEGRHAVRVTQVTTQPVCIDDGAVGDTFVL